MVAIDYERLLRGVEKRDKKDEEKELGGTLNMENIEVNAADRNVLLQAHRGSLRESTFRKGHMYGGEG